MNSSLDTLDQAMGTLIDLAIVEELRRHGIAIPYPQREVCMLSAA